MPGLNPYRPRDCTPEMIAQYVETVRGRGREFDPFSSDRVAGLCEGAHSVRDTLEAEAGLTPLDWVWTRMYWMLGSPPPLPPVFIQPVFEHVCIEFAYMDHTAPTFIYFYTGVLAEMRRLFDPRLPVD